ncbi:MAG: S-adenosylmethionine:tRNA ribosyltransferase-isomerase [Bacteroidota bacterium]|nr:S-adenosylmethionine:tRNA ribosyltransferase-isomerase [Bacteroidota bacterium]
MNPKSISISQFTYNLPEEKIAKYPLENRDESKLLVWKNNQIIDSTFSDLPQILDQSAHLFFNNTKVVHARHIFTKESGAKIEIFCLEPINGNYQIAFGSNGLSEWKCLVGNAKRWKSGILKKVAFIQNKEVIIQAEMMQQEGQFAHIKFSWDQPEIAFASLLSETGILPLPPYLNRVAEKKDEWQYQTTYAKEEGSVAAPTAGLHFTHRTFEELKNRHINTTEITLHVGAGTFLPVKANTMSEHEMHREHMEIPVLAIENLLQSVQQKKCIIPVGTTSMRSLETLYWLGVKLYLNHPNASNFSLLQWEPYELEQTISAQNALEALLSFLKENGIKTLFGSTQLLIAPGYQMRLCDALITNFHQPKSTLLLLVSALIGDNWEKVYAHALQNNYRFLSFGDSSILFKN